MAKLTRVHQKVFGDAVGAAGNFDIFGSLAAGTPTPSKDPALIQSLNAFLLGWQGAIVGNKSPSFQDMNSLFFLAFWQIAYLFQAGMAEYNPDTSYFLNSQCQVNGVEYISKIDDNLGNDPTTATNAWRLKASLYLETLYPVGELYVTHRSGNPSTLLGFGTWTQYSDGRLPAFMSNTGSAPFNTLDTVGGGVSTTLTKEQLPTELQNLAHTISNTPGSSGTGVAQAGNNASAYQNHGIFNGVGGGQPVPILPPYITCWYAWLRIA